MTIKQREALRNNVMYGTLESRCPVHSNDDTEDS